MDHGIIFQQLYIALALAISKIKVAYRKKGWFPNIGLNIKRKMLETNFKIFVEFKKFEYSTLQTKDKKQVYL